MTFLHKKSQLILYFTQYNNYGLNKTQLADGAIKGKLVTASL